MRRAGHHGHDALGQVLPLRRCEVRHIPDARDPATTLHALELAPSSGLVDAGHRTRAGIADLERVMRVAKALAARGFYLRRTSNGVLIGGFQEGW